MKLFLASFLEAQNFGPGRVISIADGEKPDHIKCDSVFTHLIPSAELSNKYSKMQLEDPSNAGKVFVSEFTKQLDQFYAEVTQTAEAAGKEPMELLPFRDGDTLASWQRYEMTHYRSIVAPYLTKLGYEVVSR